MSEAFIYVVFTSTPCGVGRFLRTVTRYHYNHVSVSLSPRLTPLYSFARYYKNAPFYGGFVQESLLRYQNGERCADALVCAVPLSARQAERAREFLSGVEGEADRYVYNMLSAACFPLRHRVLIENSFTCVEFAVRVLAESGSEDSPGRDDFCTVRQLAERLRRYAVYEGPITRYLEGADWAQDAFMTQNSLWRRTRLTLNANRRLLGMWRRG